MALNTISFTTNQEQEAWENFEVGSYEEILEIAKTNDSSFIHHLAHIAKYELDLFNFKEEEDIQGDSILIPLIKSYQCFYKKEFSKSLSYFKEYLFVPNRLLSISIFNFGVKVSLEAENYSYCLNLIELSEKFQNNKQIYIKEKIDCYYNLKAFDELLNYFKKILRFIESDSSIYLKAGLSLSQMGKYKEAEVILSKVPLPEKLPTFEEKQKEYKEAIDKIHELELNRDKLNEEELKSLGFAYLFNKEFQKAEEIFKEVIISVK
jgi:tetratricopeptide (TPR) repeat protein